MLKFNVKLFLFFILLINSTIVFASKDIVDFPWEYRHRHNKLENLEKDIAELQKDIAELQKNNDNESKKILELKYSQLTMLKQLLKKMQEDYDNICLPNSPRPSKPIYFTGKDKVWHWHPSFDYITITIGPRVRIHAKPNINVPNAPDSPEWTEHENFNVSIVDIQPGPGSIRGWGLLVAYRHHKNGWINLDDASILWGIRTYNEPTQVYDPIKNDITIFHPEAYCVDPRK